MNLAAAVNSRGTDFDFRGGGNTMTSCELGQRDEKKMKDNLSRNRKLKSICARKEVSDMVLGDPVT